MFLLTQIRFFVMLSGADGADLFFHPNVNDAEEGIAIFQVTRFSMSAILLARAVRTHYDSI
jgi:hypothetical protein